MLHKKCNKDLTPTTPPDVNNPPVQIPLKSLEDRYQVVEELGNGSFGSVSLAKAQFDVSAIHNRGGKQDAIKDTLMNQAGTEHDNFNGKQGGIVAIKTMMTRLPALHDYTRVREVKFILSIPANKHLIQIFEMFVDTRAYQLHIVMECMEQNLYQMMRHRRRRVFSIPSLKSILAQILAGIRHIHEQNFFHRDVKPENILISPSTRYFDSNWLLQGHYTDNYIVKLADFGLARHTSNKNPYTAYVSTRWYRSPEILLRSGYYSKPLDIWAFGCVALEVTVFKPLFPGSNEMDQIWKILEVLGTPHAIRESERTGYQSHGGDWEDARYLAQRLNMKFPYVEGSGLDALISSSQLQPLMDVIKSCLRWDPNQRTTAEELCMMPFFEGTVAPEECLEASAAASAASAAAAAVAASAREAAREAASNTSSEVACHRNREGVRTGVHTGVRTNTEQALIFAGIKSRAKAGTAPPERNGYHTRQLIFHSESLTQAQQHQFKENADDTINEQVQEVQAEEDDDEDEVLLPFGNPLGDYLTDGIKTDTPGELVDTDSTISEYDNDDEDDDQDEMDVSHEIAQNIACCETTIPLPFQNGQYVAPITGRDSRSGDHHIGSSVKQLADEIEAFNKQDPELYSQYYSTANTMPTEMTLSHAAGKPHSRAPFAETLNYVHYATTHQATSPASSTGNSNSTPQETNNNKHQTHSLLQPVNRLLDNMSIDDSFNNNSNSVNVNLIPRSFMLQTTPNGFENAMYQTQARAQPQAQAQVQVQVQPRARAPARARAHQQVQPQAQAHQQAQPHQQHHFSQHFGNVTF